MGDLVHKAVHRRGISQILELGRHGGRRHRRLLGGQCEMQQLDQHEACGVHQAGPESEPKRGQTQRRQREFERYREGGQYAAPSRIAQHAAVLRAAAGDVVFAGLRAAFRHFRGEQRGAAGNQRTYAAAVLPHADQLREQACRVLVVRVVQQTVQQDPDAQHPLAQLAQPKHKVDRNAVGVQMRVDRGRAMAAGFQLCLEALRGLIHLHAAEPGVAHGVPTGRKVIKRAGTLFRRGHTQPNLR